MNNKTQIISTIEQQQNRLIKGQELYNQGLVSKLENDIFIVKNQYTIEDISTENSPIYTCTCPDFMFRTEYLCKHIHAVILYQLEENNGA